MSDFVDDTPEGYDEEDTPGSGSTRPGPPPQQERRRPIPADNVPPMYSRPQLSRRQQAQPQPPQEYIQGPITPPPQVRDPYEEAPQPPRRTRNRRAKPRTERLPVDKARSGLYLPWWSLLIMLAFVGCAAVGILVVVSGLEGGSPAAGQTPLIVVITSTFTAGPPASPTTLPQKPTLTASPPLPTIPPTLTLPPGDFAIGNIVTVIGVGDSSLNVRSSPGTGATVKFRAKDGDVFVLKDGPQQASGDEWWFIQDQNDTTKSGWASRRFLTVSAAGSTPQPTKAP
jgi:hypothetical protein